MGTQSVPQYEVTCATRAMLMLRTKPTSVARKHIQMFPHDSLQQLAKNLVVLFCSSNHIRASCFASGHPASQQHYAISFAALA
jgi:hypothetical protein